MIFKVLILSDYKELSYIISPSRVKCFLWNKVFCYKELYKIKDDERLGWFSGRESPQDDFSSLKHAGYSWL